MLERGEMGGFGRRDLVDGHVGHRHEPTGDAADRIVVAVFVGNELAAVGALAEAWRQELRGDEFVDGVGGRAFGLRGHAGELERADLADRSEPAIELDAISGARQMTEERRREIEKDRIVAGDRHLGARVLKLGRGGERCAVGWRGVEAFDESAACGDQVEVAVDRIVRAEPAIGRRKIGHVVAGDRDGFELGAGMLVDGFAALAVEVLAEQQVVVGLEHDAEGCAVAHVVVEAHEADIVNHLGAHDAAHRRFVNGELILQAIARSMIDAAQRDHVAEVVLPMVEEVAVPEIIREAAETLVEAFARDVGGEGRSTV